MNILEYILYKLKNIDSMYYEILCYIIITFLIMGGFNWIVSII